MMPPHILTGKLGEDFAAQHLENQNYRIAARNYQAGRGEIDLIAWSPKGVLVFVEVKTRSLDLALPPEESVDRKKQDRIARAAGAYMYSLDYEGEIRFDIISVVLRNGLLVSVTWMEDAFFPNG